MNTKTGLKIVFPSGRYSGKRRGKGQLTKNSITSLFLLPFPLTFFSSLFSHTVFNYFISHDENVIIFLNYSDKENLVNYISKSKDWQCLLSRSCWLPRKISPFTKKEDFKKSKITAHTYRNEWQTDFSFYISSYHFHKVNCQKKWNQLPLYSLSDVK